MFSRLLLVMSLLPLAGCATVFGGGSAPVTIYVERPTSQDTTLRLQASEPGAEQTLHTFTGDDHVNETLRSLLEPRIVRTSLRGNLNYVLLASSPGYELQTIAVPRGPNWWALGDLVPLAIAVPCYLIGASAAASTRSAVSVCPASGCVTASTPAADFFGVLAWALVGASVGMAGTDLLTSNLGRPASELHVSLQKAP